MKPTPCFAAGTQGVLSVDASGHQTTKNIQEVQVAGLVLTRNQNDPTAPIEQRPVTAVSYDPGAPTLSSPPSSQSAKIILNLRTITPLPCLSCLAFISPCLRPRHGEAEAVNADSVLDANAPAFKCGGNEGPPSTPISNIRGYQLFVVPHRHRDLPNVHIPCLHHGKT